MRTKKKDADIEEEVATPPSTTSATATPLVEKPSPSPPITQVVKLREPIPEDQQRELFKWMLEEKRKVKPKDPVEKKRLDDEKAILKQFIRAKSIPIIYLQHLSVGSPACTPLHSFGNQDFLKGNFNRNQRWK
ncbi:hypothetical protein CMV_023754 [Castanea mollissima]|uniref:Uncharacterized protein n=1 Tax=Castanea mollissima TaxID=60419 RepID=A0A8J4VIX7_9ROSI|nr:hypothetical protein CMV_023754 [Castanea mollissima]